MLTPSIRKGPRKNPRPGGFCQRLISNSVESRLHPPPPHRLGLSLPCPRSAPLSLRPGFARFVLLKALRYHVRAVYIVTSQSNRGPHMRVPRRLVAERSSVRYLLDRLVRGRALKHKVQAVAGSPRPARHRRAHWRVGPSLLSVRPPKPRCVQCANKTGVHGQ